MAKVNQIYIGSDTDVAIKVLKDNRTGAAINDATVTFTVRDSGGDVVGGLENVAMDYLAASKGHYYGTIPSSTALAEGATYEVAISIVASSGRDRTVRVDAVAVVDAG